MGFVGCKKEQDPDTLKNIARVEAINITEKSATFKLVDVENPSSIEHFWVKYDTIPIRDKSKVISREHGSSSIALMVEDLKPNTTYYYCGLVYSGSQENQITGSTFFFKTKALPAN